MKTTALFTEEISKIITIVSVKMVIYFTIPGFFTAGVSFNFSFLKRFFDLCGKLKRTASAIKKPAISKDAKEIKFLLWKQRKYYDVIVHPNKEFNDINHPRLIPELLKHAISESTH